MGTKITKSNVKSAMKDDAAHISYLKRDVLDDQKGGGKYKDINQTADEEHISKLAGDIKHDHSFLSKHWNHSSPLNNMEMVGSAGSFDKNMYDAPDLAEFDAQAFDANKKAQQDKYMQHQKEKEEIQPGDSTEQMGSKLDDIADKASKVDTNLTGKKDSSDFSKYTNPSLLNSVEVVRGEVDGIAYGAADVDGHIAVDTSTVGYDDTMNLP